MASSPPVANKRDHLEALLRRFEDLAIEVIIKEDLLCDGVEFVGDTRLSGLKDPWRSLTLEGGPFQLFRTIVRPPIRAGSPYVIELDPMDDRPVLKDRATGASLAYVREYPMEPSYHRRSIGGVLLGDVVRPDGEVIVAPPCEHGGNKSCLICSTQGIFKRSANGQEQVIHVRSPELIGQAAFDAYALEEWPLQEGPLRISFDAGRTSSVYEGVSEDDFFQPYVAEIQRRLHSVWHVMLTMMPKNPEIEDRLLEAGVSVRTAPLGVWDPQLFNGLYPELAQYMPYEQWIRWFGEAPYVYANGAVLVDMDIGAELATGRFESQAEALASTRSGFRFLIHHGVLPRLRHWVGPDGSGANVPVEYFLEVNRAWYQVWVEAQTNEPHTYIMGVGRNRWPYSASWEVGRGGPPEYARKWDKELLGEPGYRVPEAPRG